MNRVKEIRVKSALQKSSRKQNRISSTQIWEGRQRQSSLSQYWLFLMLLLKLSNPGDFWILLEKFWCLPSHYAQNARSPSSTCLLKTPFFSRCDYFPFSNFGAAHPSSHGYVLRPNFLFPLRLPICFGLVFRFSFFMRALSTFLFHAAVNFFFPFQWSSFLFHPCSFDLSFSCGCQIFFISNGVSFLSFPDHHFFSSQSFSLTFPLPFLDEFSFLMHPPASCQFFFPSPMRLFSSKRAPSSLNTAHTPSIYMLRLFLSTCQNRLWQ